MTPEEIQEMLANFENRLSFLENSLPGSAMSYRPEEQSSNKSLELLIQTDCIEQNEKYKQIDRIVRVVYQLKNEIAYLHNEVYELQKLQGLHGEVPREGSHSGKRQSKY